MASNIPGTSITQPAPTATQPPTSMIQPQNGGTVANLVPNPATPVNSTYTTPENNPISASSMQGSVSPLNVTTPNPTPVPDISSLYSPTPTTLGPNQTEASDLTKQIEGLNSQLTGKSAYQQGLYQQQGFAVDQNGKPTNQTLVDLQNQLKGLTIQAQQIPLQIQNTSVGRRSMSQAQDQTDIALRNNAVQALGISALVSAQQGMLGLAKAQIDQAVTAKFGPLEEQQKALMANLDLILKDPATTNEEKNAAQAQQAAQQQKADQIAQDKANYTATQNEILKYAGIADGATLADMQKATSPIQVAQIASQHGLQTADQQTAALDAQYKKAEIAKIYTDINATNNNGGIMAQANTRQTTSGITYVDGTNLTGKDAIQAQQFAANNGIPYLDKTTADLQNNVETARQNMTNISNTLDGVLAKSGWDIAGKIENWLEAGTQIGPNADALASFNAYRSAAIQALRAMAGAKGLRINQAEIMQSVNQDIPKITDSIGVAKAKIAIVNSLLDSQEKGTFGSQYYKPTTGTQGGSSSTVIPENQIPAGYYQASDGLLYPKQ